MSQGASKKNENPEPQFVSCKSAEKRRTSTDTYVFKIIKRKYKGNATKTLSNSELPLTNKFVSLSEEECFIDNESENSEKVRYHGPRKMKRTKCSTAKNQKDMKEVNEVSQGESKSQSVHKSKSSKNLKSTMNDKTNELRFLLFKKIDDFQQSRGCKVKRIYRNKAQKDRKKTEVLYSQYVNLIKERIKQIEFNEAIYRIPEVQMKKIIPLHLIPYLALFICLNLECFINHSHITLSRNKIIDSAKYCARKFEVKQQDNNYFYNYCNRKISKQFGNQSKPIRSQLELIKTVVSLYNKTFYQTEKELKIDYNETSDQEHTTSFETKDHLHMDDEDDEAIVFYEANSFLQADGNEDVSDDFQR